ncbi:MAG TPA: ankyrin repeat domain-containing protein [Gammaproteobacteria bacterium]|nr:ankyrin repeat domain-containing protein [Gammaproteobacteria bacterium]
MQNNSDFMPNNSDFINMVLTGQIREVKAMLEAGANANGITPDGTSPALAAVSTNNVDMLRLLLTYEARVNIPDRMGRTAISFAEQKGSPAITQILGLKPKV